MSRRPVALGAAIVLFALLVPTAGVNAQDTPDYTVHLGAEIPAAYDDVPVTVNRFFPGKLLVHEGDTVTFTSEFGAVALLPEGVDADEWLEDNADDLNEPFNSFTLDPDDGPGALKLNNTVAFGEATCGTTDTPCTFDGSTVLDSGTMGVAADTTWTVTIDGRAGDLFWVVNLIDQATRMRIEVIADTETASDQTAIDANMDAQVSQILDSAEAMHNRLLTRQSKHRVGGITVWDAWAGFDTEDYALLAMYPARLNLRQGQRVRIHFDQLEHEIHTATFGFPRFNQVASEVFSLGCDPDGDSGTTPDTPPQLEGPPFCTDPTQVEVDFPAEVALSSGDGKVTSHRDFENSAARGDQLPSNAPFNVTFPKPSGDKPFKFKCLIHPFMQGKVAVKR